MQALNSFPIILRIADKDVGGKEVLMNGIGGVSFQEAPGGLRVHVKKSQKKSTAGKRRKRLPYNFKQLSKQIMQAKTSDAVRSLVTKARANLSWLYKKLRSGEYGDSEIAAAIIHAAAMERIAKRKVRHLEEEEAAENGTVRTNAPGEDVKEELQKGIEENEEFSEEMKRQMMEEIEELEEELSKDMMSELQDMISCAGGELTEEEIEEIKQKHRQEEEKQLTRADLEYLKALFYRLEQEKRQTLAGNSMQSGEGQEGFTCVIDCLPDVETGDADVGKLVDTCV